MDVNTDAREQLEETAQVAETAPQPPNHFWIGFGWLVLICGALVFLNSSRFSLQQVGIRGNHSVSKEALIMAARLNLDQTSVMLSPDRIERAIAANPRIAKVVVHVRYPDRLLITVVERRPLCWVKQGLYWYILGTDLAPIEIVSESPLGQLPELTGLGRHRLKLGVIPSGLGFKTASLRQLIQYPSHGLGCQVLQVDIRKRCLKVERAGNPAIINVIWGDFSRIPEKAQQLRAVLARDPAAQIVSIDLRTPGVSTVTTAENNRFP